MPARSPDISPRKAPKQQRSTRLVADILEAAIRVLEREGAGRFTMARVAEKAGVSVGSLYQYFPNKEAILFRLQTAEWDETHGVLAKILTEPGSPPEARLRKAIRFFFRSEHAEARWRVALEDAAPLYRDAPETQAHRRKGSRLMMDFLAEVLPRAQGRERAFVADIAATTMSAVGKRVSEQNRPRSEIDAFADATADMLCAFLASRKI
ncbi:MAG TPA: TetR family transcriptional regulator [Rhizomicrobium sp.]|jgi:AcrR family transcriptional regulator|nr:TetR family transcriptional regulator [Rhizomicrobium sp.]